MGRCDPVIRPQVIRGHGLYGRNDGAASVGNLPANRLKLVLKHDVEGVCGMRRIVEEELREGVLVLVISEAVGDERILTRPPVEHGEVLASLLPVQGVELR